MNKRLIAAMLLVIVFALGGVTGIALGPIMHPPHGRLPATYGGLELTPEQEEQGRLIIAKHQAELEAVLSELRPRAQAIHAQIRSEIDAILTPEQREKLRMLESIHPGPHTGEAPPPPPWPPR